jgi:hypothetical protein
MNLAVDWLPGVVLGSQTGRAKSATCAVYPVRSALNCVRMPQGVSYFTGGRPSRS